MDEISSTPLPGQVQNAEDKDRELALYSMPLSMLGLIPRIGAKRNDTCTETKLDAIAVRLEAIATRVEAIASRLEAIATRVEAIASRLEAIATSRVEAITTRLEAIATRVKAIAIRNMTLAVQMLGSARALHSRTDMDRPIFVNCHAEMGDLKA